MNKGKDGKREREKEVVENWRCGDKLHTHTSCLNFVFFS